METSPGSDVVRDVVTAELRDLLIEASALKQNINDAKTVAKKQYYTKKFEKVSTQIIQMTAALERMPNGDDSTASPSSAPSSTATVQTVVKAAPVIRTAKEHIAKSRITTRPSKRASGGGSRQFTT